MIMPENQNEKIINLKLQIDHLKEYINTDICRKCEEISQQLKDFQRMLDEYSRPNMGDQE
jgi:hypothetical protein